MFFSSFLRTTFVLFRLDWLIQRCLQVYLSELNPSTNVSLHSALIGKGIFSGLIERDLKHSTMTIRDYSRFVRNREEEILLAQIEKHPDWIESLPDQSVSNDVERFARLERLCRPLILPIREIAWKNDEDDQLLLVESIIRSHLTHLRAIYSFPRLHSVASSSSIDLFLAREHQHLIADQDDLSRRMEQLLEILPTSDVSLLTSNALVRSILYDRPAMIKNFVNNYGSALEYLSKATPSDVNLKFIRRRRALIRLLRLEQASEQEEELIFQVIRCLSVSLKLHF